ncbi:MAG: alanine--glyoxylate aminotransferase family protein, partial [Chloroflexota bacterium]|nr:alanine--glyoxylate aminotransferase family protein [Chloroflexota bacterium]
MPQNLRVPGPTPLPAAVRSAQAAPMINHRGPEFAELLTDVTERLRRLLDTRAEVLILTGSGTGALEAAIVNTLSPGDPVLAATIGEFGDRFAAIAEAFGADVERLPSDRGSATEPEALERALGRGDAPYRAVLLTHNETSTGVCNDIRRLAAVARRARGEPLVIVDGISGLGAMPFELDAWGVDLVVSASQKAWMGSPGLAFAVLAERAQAAAETARMPRFYWDFREARRWAREGQTPWTPAVSVLYGLRVGLERLEAEGREATWARHAAIARATRAGLEALGLRLVAAPEHRSNTVSAAWLPDGVVWTELSTRAHERGLVIAGGQGTLKGRILRIGHMGEVTIDDVVDALSVLRALL